MRSGILPQVVYLHGLQSSGQSVTVQRLQRALPHHDIIAPDIPLQPEVALSELRKLEKTLRPDALVIGTSMGGMYARLFHTHRRILINPSFHPSRHLASRIGERLPFHNPRLDGAVDFEVTDKFVRKLERLEAGQFDRKNAVPAGTPDDADNVEAFFGLHDDVVNGKDEYLSHYTRYTDFDGGHRLDPNTTLNLIVPRILELLPPEK